MRKTILLLLLLACLFRVNGQTPDASYADSVARVLVTSGLPEGARAATAFQQAWKDWGPSLRETVRRQQGIIRGTAYPLQTFLHHVMAVTGKHGRPSDWLQVAELVMAQDSQDRVMKFLANSALLNTRRLMHNDRTFSIQLRAGDFNYFWEQDVDQNPAITDSLPTGTPYQSLIPIPYSGPAIRFEQATLRWATSGDTLEVFGVSGTFALADDVLALNGAAVRWKDGQGLKGVSFGTSQKWYLRSDVPEFRIDQGNLRIPDLTDRPVPGVMIWKAQPGVIGVNPSFASYSSDLVLRTPGKYDRLQLLGGINLRGQKLSYQSAAGSPMVMVLRDTLNAKRLQVRAGRIDFFGSLIMADNAAVSIYQGRDSIFHPAVNFQFFFSQSRVELKRGTSQQKDVPYSSSYFRVAFTADRMIWHLKQDSIAVFSESAAAQAPVIVQSQDYYDEEDFRLLRGVGFNFHALGLVGEYVRRSGKKNFYTADLAEWSKEKLPLIRAAMEFLHSKGMVNYNNRSGEVTVKPEALRIISFARKKADYDNFKVVGFPEDEQAMININLRKGQMAMRGTEEFGISDSLNVNIRPKGYKLQLGKNRNVTFSGRVTAGNFEIHGRDFEFRYDSFLIRMKHIDSIRFLVTQKNALGETVRKRLSNSMVGSDSTLTAAQQQPKESSGTLYLNRPDNRSGRLKLPNYPRLNATMGGVFFFDRSDILGGVYDRSIYFVSPPFKMDSMNNSNAAAFRFKGAFVTSGMFPVFKDELHTMPDQSLGFLHTIPPAGYSLYQGPGKLKGLIQLDKKGIVGNGRLEFLAAEVQSDRFTFYKDSVVAPGKSGKVVSKTIGEVSFPQVSFPSFRMKWIPGGDNLGIFSLKDPFRLYDSTASLKGSLQLTSKGVKGRGKLMTRGSELTSEDMHFESNTFGASHALFRVLSADSTKPALEAKNVRVNLDLKASSAEIVPEQIGDAAFSFPYAQFNTSIPTARWDLKNQRITMTKAESTPIEQSYFYTTRKDLDSLVFQGTAAEYDIITQQLKVTGIPYITVADARITPENGEVLILKDAQIGQLKNTTIVLDTLNGYHRLTEGVIDIVSRNEFKGYGVYNYLNAFRDTFRIRMSAFHLDTADRDDKAGLRQTVAYGEVPEADRLLLAPRMYYKGRLTMRARKPALDLEGLVRFDVRNHPSEWLMYNHAGEDEDYTVDFDQALDQNGKRASAGIHLTSAQQLYVTFLDEKKNPDDEDFFLPSGKLFYDTGSHQFRIEDLRKAKGETLSGKVFAYDEDKQEVKFEGPITLLPKQKDFQVETSAIGHARINSDDIRLNVMLIPDFDAPTNIMMTMAQRIAAVVKKEGAPEGHGDPTELLYKLANQVGEETAKDYETRSLKSYVSLSVIRGMQKPMVFSNVDLRWSSANKGFYSTGDLGLSHIGTTDINGAFEGFIEMRRNEDGSPVFNLFLKASPEEWYFIGYEDNRLMMFSSSDQFNSLVDKRTNAGKAKPGELVIITGSEEETFNWVNSFRSKYLSIDSPYELNGSRGSEVKKEKKKKDDKDDGF